jgi:hypothetical protein
MPFGIRVAYEYPRSWELVRAANRANLGVCLDSFHILAGESGLEALADIDPGKVFLVQLSDFMWHEARSRDERIDTARHFRVFPGEGVHSEKLAELVRRVDETGYRGDYSFEVFNDDYRTLPLPMVAERARRAVKWLTDQVSRRSLPPRRRGPAVRRNPPCAGPIIEVHISNIHARDELHRHSKLSSAVKAVICGLGPYGYIVALQAAAQLLGGLPDTWPACLREGPR